MCLYAVQDYFQFVQNYFQYIFYSWPDGFVDNKIFSTLWAEAVFNIFPVIYSFENFQQQIFHNIGEVVYALFCMLFCYHSSTVKKKTSSACYKHDTLGYFLDTSTKRTHQDAFNVVLILITYRKFTFSNNLFFLLKLRPIILFHI